MISIVTVTFNNYDELILTLSSLPSSVESVVVNGGDCERTKNYLLTYKGKSITEKDRGISDGFNKGFKLASGDYIVYVNSGDKVIDQEYFIEAEEMLNSRPELDFVYADINFIDQFAGEIRVRSINNFPHMPYLHPTLIVRKSLMERIGLFNLEYKNAMDLDFAYRLIKSGAKGHYIPRMVVKMDGQGVSSQNYIRGFKEVVRIIFRNRDYSPRSISFIVKRVLSLLGKVLLLKLGGSKILGLYRSIRYKIN